MNFNLHKPPSAKITQCVFLQNTQFSQWSLNPAVDSLIHVRLVPLVDTLGTYYKKMIAFTFDTFDLNSMTIIVFWN